MPIVWLKHSVGAKRSGFYVVIDGQVVTGPFATRRDAWSCEYGAQPCPPRGRDVDLHEQAERRIPLQRRDAFGG
jgi:hypothetical protein